MRRREFITLLGGAAAAWPLAARAQPAAKAARIGLLATGDSPEQRLTIDAFRQGLRELGYVEGRDIVIQYRLADGRIERLPELAHELVALKVDVIYALATAAGLAARQATATTPIVVSAMGDPVRDGLVASLARPGANVTGSTFLGPELVPKRLALLKELLPGLSRVAVLWHPDAFSERTMSGMRKETAAAADALALELAFVEAHGPDEIERAFAAVARERAEALFFRARCCSRNDDKSSSFPPCAGCPGCSKPASSSSSAASSAMARAFQTCTGGAQSTCRGQGGHHHDSGDLSGRRRPGQIGSCHQPRATDRQSHRFQSVD